MIQRPNLLLLDFWSLGQLHPKDLSTRVPTQVTCQIFKESLWREGHSEARPQRAAERAGKYSPAAIPVNISSQRWSAQGPVTREPEGVSKLRARIIGPKAALSTKCHDFIPAALERCFCCRFIAPSRAPSGTADAQSGAARSAGCNLRRPAAATQHPTPSHR